MIFGKLLCGLFGLLSGGLVGLFWGLIVGHLFDKALRGYMGKGGAEDIAQVQSAFFDTTFLLAGHIAKADGRISGQEVAHTEQLFVQLGLDQERRVAAIALFQRGASAEFSAQQSVHQFTAAIGFNRQLKQALLLFLISLAHADGELVPSEHAAMVDVARYMGIDAAQFARLLRMATAQEQFHQRGNAAPGAASQLEDAYTALGVEAAVSDRDLKRAYRKLMSEHHPDKLIAKGVPEEMVKLATERSQEIQAAYEMARKQRGIRR
ncbi:MAG: DnaJ like chaperone protein [Bacteroidia bacterium]|jgi:DnaJ like chaperone protein